MCFKKRKVILNVHVSVMSSSGVPDEKVLQDYNRLRQEQNKIMSRIAEFENESHEHELVAEELRPLAKDRCCHRLVGGALVERTVGEVLPEIEANLQGIRESLNNLNKALTDKEKEMDEFMAKHHLTRPSKSGEEKVSANAGDGNRGVLA